MRHSRSGMTLIELVVAMALLGGAVIAFLASFAQIQRSVIKTKNRTIATSLCRERMETLRNKRYPLLRATTQSDLDTFGYDNTHIPPELGLSVGGTRFDRYSRVDKARLDSSGATAALPPSAPDAGLKRVQVWVQWKEEGVVRRYEMNSLFDDPNRARPAGAVTGTIFRAPGGSGNELAGANVRLDENPSRADVTGASGVYRISTSSGSFHVRASARGWFDSVRTVSAAPDGLQDFTLAARGTGRVTGTAYLRDHLVVSQVVASTIAPDGFEVQFVELYNPTTTALFVGSLSSHTVRLRYQSPHLSQDCPDLGLEYVATTVAPLSSYLIANASSFVLAGATVTADAYVADTGTLGCAAAPSGWSPPGSRRVLEPGQAGTIAVYSGGALLDAVGWTRGGASPALCEGSCVALAAGLATGEQLVRLSGPGAAPAAADGRAYDTGENASDFAAPPLVTGLEAPARAGSMGPQPAATGTPAAGAVVSADDDLSSPVLASATGYFSLSGVATCTAAGYPATWNLLVSSKGAVGEASGLALTAGGTVALGSVALTSSAASAIVTGVVLSSLGPPATGLVMTAGAATTLTDASGFYRLVVDAGQTSVTANAAHANPGFASVSSGLLNLGAGQTLGGVDFTLDPVGSVRGVITSNGVDPLPGVAVRADASGVTRSATSSDASGSFLLQDLPVSALSGVGTYSIIPTLDVSQVSSPASAAATVVQAAELTVATFTVSGALGTITGSVADAGAPITTGVLIMATQVSVGGTPPDWDEALRGGTTMYYSAHARPDGTYVLPVRVSGSPYNVYAWYSKLSGGTSTTSLKSAAQTVTSSSGSYVLSFTWP